MQVGFEGDNLGVLVEDLVGVQFLARLSCPDVDVAAVAQAEEGAAVSGLVVGRVEAEADLQVGAGVAAVGVQVQRVRDDGRTRSQETARVLVEDVGLAAYFVDGPAYGSGAVARLGLGHARAPDHVVHDEAAADGVAPLVCAFCVAADVVDLADLDGLGVAVFGEAGRDGFDVAPPVGDIALDQHLGEADDQVGFARDPHDVVVELERGRQVGGVAFGRSGAPPLLQRVDLGVV